MYSSARSKVSQLQVLSVLIDEYVLGLVWGWGHDRRKSIKEKWGIKIIHIENYSENDVILRSQRTLISR